MVEPQHPRIRALITVHSTCFVFIYIRKYVREGEPSEQSLFFLHDNFDSPFQHVHAQLAETFHVRFLRARPGLARDWGLGGLTRRPPRFAGLPPGFCRPVRRGPRAGPCVPGPDPRSDCLPACGVLPVPRPDLFPTRLAVDPGDCPDWSRPRPITWGVDRR